MNLSKVDIKYYIEERLKQIEDKRIANDSVKSFIGNANKNVKDWSNDYV